MKALIEVEYDDLLVGIGRIVDNMFDTEGVEGVEIKDVSE